jgi:hypothetical protein
MNGKIVLKHWKMYYNKTYSANSEYYGIFNHTKDWYTSRDSIAKALYTLTLSNDVTIEEYQNLIRLLHSPDEENWKVLESIIEGIDTDNEPQEPIYNI